MLVGIDTLGLKPGWGGGEEIYLRNVLSKMAQFERSARFLVFTDPENHDSYEPYDRVCVNDPDTLDDLASEHKVDLLFSSVLRAPARGTVPIVLYVMELRSLVSDNRSRRRGAAAAHLKDIKHLCARARTFVAPSDFMKQQILDVLEVPLNRTLVAPLGVAEAFGTPQDCIIEKPYILMVGNTHSYKNYDAVMEAFERISRDLPHNLVIVGQPFEAEREEWGARVIRIDRLPVPQLAGLYQHCAVFVCASSYEGSGVTVIEALMAGALVASGRVGGITEIASDAPIFFNAGSVDSLVAALRRGVQEGEDSRMRRSRSGKQLASEYTWERCATQTMSAFRRALR
ncbi:MAG: glycosyltransferase family 4 protein [Candidatus Hydrogenedentes bacterium]|nr:glycosyltransferase family 4 protein [Candidatus Hydrogenedentota bacterium]